MRAGIGIMPLVWGTFVVAGCLSAAPALGDEGRTSSPSRRMVRVSTSPEGAAPRTVRRVSTSSANRPVPVSSSSGTWVQTRWVSAASPRTTRVVWVRVPADVDHPAPPPAAGVTRTPAPRRVEVASAAPSAPAPLSRAAAPARQPVAVPVAPRSRTRYVPIGGGPACGT
ncbi:MAG: hypothetical protein AB7T63_09420 [Planctomycetota bacterium]